MTDEEFDDRVTFSAPLPVPYLHECLAYDAETGKLSWKERPRAHFKNDRSHIAWNRRWAGSAAGSLNGNGYLTIRLNGAHFKAHRAIWAMTHGEWPTQIIDHINRTKTDNRLTNLRLATHSLNIRNADIRANNRSGYVGISMQENRWKAQIQINGESYHLGLYPTLREANAARQGALHVLEKRGETYDQR